MKRLPIFLFVLLMSMVLHFPASASRLSDAGSVSWWGGTVFLDEDTGELFSLETDAVLLTGILDLDWDGDSLWVETEDHWYRIEADDSLTKAGYSPDPDADESCYYGFVISNSDDKTVVCRLLDGAVLLRTDRSDSVQICRDDETGENYTYIFSSRKEILRGDGSPVIPEKEICGLVHVFRFSFVMKGYAFGYLEPFDEEHPQAAVIRLSDGKITAVFDGWWCDYVDWGMIYADDTAVMSTPEDPYTPSRIVNWAEGEVLLDLPMPGSEISLRYANQPFYSIHAYDTDFFLYPDIEAPPEALSAPSVEYVFDGNGRSAGMRVLGSDLKPIGENLWENVIPYEAHDMDLLSEFPEIFNPDGGAEVVSTDQKVGVLGMDGRMILPAVFDSVSYRQGEGYLVRKDSHWEIYDLTGKKLY